MTKAGEVIAILTGFLGVCMAAILTGIVASAFSNQMSRKKAAYQSQLRQVMADGVMSDAERESLRQLQVKYRLSDAQVQAAMDEAKSSKSN
jgi:voltage-gated potassium channel